MSIISLYRLALPPKDFIPETFVQIPDGYSLKQIGSLLEERSVIRSQAVFSMIVTYDDKEKNIAAGDYVFATAEPVWAIARRMVSGSHGIATHKITLPEGITVLEMSKLLARELPDFNNDDFIAAAKVKEGYLFPDTYFFFSTATSGPIIKTIEQNFKKKTAKLFVKSSELGEDWADVITLASIVEKEAATAEDRRIIAGILKRRMAEGMRLQVDAPFLYTLGKTSAELTVQDLSSDSPYNTYKYSGLPPTPIGNPGADAIASVLYPEITSYLYYLSDENGKMYYAKTFEEHKMNKATYLK